MSHYSGRLIWLGILHTQPATPTGLQCPLIRSAARGSDAIGPNPAQFKWRGRDGNDPSVDIAKDADHWF